MEEIALHTRLSLVDPLTPGPVHYRGNLVRQYDDTTMIFVTIPDKAARLSMDVIDAIAEQSGLGRDGLASMLAQYRAHRGRP